MNRAEPKLKFVGLHAHSCAGSPFDAMGYPAEHMDFAYENGMDASIEVAIRLEELFGPEITVPIDIFNNESKKTHRDALSNKQEVNRGTDAMVDTLTRFGFIVHPTDRAPFKTVSEHSSDSNRVLITGHSRLTKTAIKRAKIMGSIGYVTKTQSVYFVDDNVKQKHVEETILIGKNMIQNYAAYSSETGATGRIHSPCFCTKYFLIFIFFSDFCLD